MREPVDLKRINSKRLLALDSTAAIWQQAGCSTKTDSTSQAPDMPTLMLTISCHQIPITAFCCMTCLSQLRFYMWLSTGEAFCLSQSIKKSFPVWELWPPSSNPSGLELSECPLASTAATQNIRHVHCTQTSASAAATSAQDSNILSA